MRKIVSSVAAAALLGSVGLAVALPGAVAGAAKGPVTATCSQLIGSSANQLLDGCSSASGAKITAQGVAIPNSGDTGATITWLNKKTTTESFTYTSVTDTCATYGGAAPSLEEQETATITGGNSKLSLQSEPPADVCIYIDGTNGSILVVSAGSLSL